MNDEQLLRFSRHILLPEIDIQGQQKLLDATVLIVGLGGLGSPVSMYLAASGVGRLLLADHDKVELGNLQRQILYDTHVLGSRKTDSAAQVLQAINPSLNIEIISEKLGNTNLQQYVDQSDVVVDCSDNFQTRFYVNSACISAKKPLVSGAAIRWEGQVAVFDPCKGGPCYQCLYPNAGDENENCTNNGVLSPLLGVIGSLQAVEVIKCLLGAGEQLTTDLLIIDLLKMDIRRLSLKKDPLCPACSFVGI